MNNKLEQEIFDRFKFFKPERSIIEALMAFGFECGDGWFNLIWKLCEDIEKTKPAEDFEVVQVKEKFGGLRFYVTNSTEKVFKLINIAEEESYKICEVCGKPGSVDTKKHWVKTLCEEHRA